MSVMWRVVLLFSFWIVFAAVGAQSNEEEDFFDDNNDYDDWTDRFDDIFKDSDDYEETLRKINEARVGRELDLDSAPQKSKDDVIFNDFDSQPRIEDDGARQSKEFYEEGNDVLGLLEEHEKSDEEVIEDDNINGNAPANDYDPLEVDTIKSKEDTMDESNVMHEDEFETRSLEEIKPNSEVLDDQAIDSQGIIDPIQMQLETSLESGVIIAPKSDLQSIFQETQDILDNDSSSDSFIDEDNPKIEDVPQKITDEAQTILEQDSHNEFENKDAIFEDINEDLESLLNTLDKLEAENENASNAEMEVLNTELNDSQVQEKQYVDNQEKENEIVEEDVSQKTEEEKTNEWEPLSYEKIEDDEREIVKSKSYIETTPKEGESFAEDEKTLDQEIETQRDRMELAELNALIEKQLKEIDNIDEEEDIDEDYKDFYDDDIQEKDKIEETEIPSKHDSVISNDSEIEDKIKSVENHALANDEFVAINEQERKENVNIVPKDTTELTSQEINENFESLYQANIELEAKISEVPAIHMTLSVDDPITVTSPEYPSPYPANNIIDWIFDGEGGTGIEFNITDLFINGEAGDYLLIKPGGIDASSNDGIIFTYQLRHERKYRFFNADKIFVRFESKAALNDLYRGFQFSVKFIDHKRERTLDPEPIPEPVAQEPKETLTVFLTGVAPHEFMNISEQFRTILVDMTAMFVAQNSIDPGVLPLTEVVQITRTTVCNINWPDHRSCSAVTFGVPLFYNETEVEEEYQLNREQLVDMWFTYSNIDPFATRLRILGITEYAVPNDRAVMSSWWLISFAVLMFILGLGFSLWRWNCFEDYTGMTRLSETDSVFSETRKSDLSLYPTPHQNLPAMFAEDQYDKYLDGDLPPKYADTTRVDMGGAFDNKSFVRDGELFDLDSDEEIIMSLPDDGKGTSRNSADIRPKDIFEV